MMHDNGILSSLKRVSKPLTLKEALSRWGNDPIWHKLVSKGYIQYYPKAVIVTSAGDKFLKERELHRWALAQKLEDAKNKAECWEIRKYASLALFPDIEKAAFEKAAIAEDCTKMMEKLEEISSYSIEDFWDDPQYVEGMMLSSF